MNNYYSVVYHMSDGSVYCLRNEKDTPRDIALAELKSRFLYGKTNHDNVICETDLNGEEILIMINRVCWVELDEYNPTDDVREFIERRAHERTVTIKTPLPAEYQNAD